MKIHYAWLICITCMLLLFCNAGMANSSFPTHFPIFREVYGITNTQCSTLLMIRNFASLVVLTFVNRFISFFGLKRSMIIASVIVCISFVVYASSSTFPMFCAAATISGAGYSLGGFVSIAVFMKNWFHKSRGVAIGICNAGVGIAAIAMPPAIASFSARFDVRTTLYGEAVIVAAVALFALFVLRNRPQDQGLTAYGEEEGLQAEAERRADTDAKTSALICVYVAGILLGFAVYGGHQVLQLHLVTEGFPNTTAAVFESLFGVTLLIGKILYGYLADRAGALKITLLFFAMTIFGFVTFGMIHFYQGIVFIVISVLVWGLGNSVSTVMQPAIAAEMATDASYTRITKNLQRAYSAGSVLVGPLPGWIADRTGSFFWSYIIMSILLTASGIFVYAGMHSRNK